MRNKKYSWWSYCYGRHGKVVHSWSEIVREMYTNLLGIRDLHDSSALHDAGQSAIMKEWERCYSVILVNEITDAFHVALLTVNRPSKGLIKEQSENKKKT